MFVSPVEPFGIDGPFYATANFVDIDGDGDLDGMVGGSYSVVFFENTGTAAMPAFATGIPSPFGLPAKLSPFGTEYTCPTFADIDGDGDFDAIAGAGGSIVLYENTGDASNPAFAGSVANPFGFTDPGSRSICPEFADIDDDDDLDAFVGVSPGDTIFFENTGEATAPAFAASASNPFGISNVGIVAIPELADIDSDGDLDLAVGRGDGDILYFENSGDASNPTFAAAITNPFGLPGVGDRATPDFVDIDADGDLDALVGDAFPGDIVFFRNRDRSPERTAPDFRPNFGIPEIFYGTPTFIDIDGDGDFDGMIGDGTRVQFLQNDGTRAAPSFAAPVSAPFGLPNRFTLEDAYVCPTFVDIDGDQDPDGFAGDTDGVLYFVENSGDASNPAFAPTVTSPFGLPTFGGGSLCPEFADIDGDGDVDAFFGLGSGDTLFAENTGNQTAPAFAPSSMNPFGLSAVGVVAIPEFADVDEDGDLDALVAEYSGATYYFENTGDASNPAFAAPLPNQFGLTPVSSRAAPDLVDIDDDGDLDAFVSELFPGATLFFENIGCGNGGLDTGEECDDGNASDADACLTSCDLAACGDGIVCSDAETCTSGAGGGVEACDDGNADDGDACLSTCQVPGGDDDGDGIDNEEENNGPGGGDGNGDGTLDSVQPNVATVPGAKDGLPITVQVDPGCTVEDLMAVDFTTPDYVLPYGGVSFALRECPASSVTVFFHAADSLDGNSFDYVKRGPNPPGAANDVVYALTEGGPPHHTVFGSIAMPHDPAVGFATFDLADGVAGDATGVDGDIVDPGGPGIATVAPAPTLGWKGLALGFLTLLGVVRRKLRGR